MTGSMVRRNLLCLGEEDAQRRHCAAPELFAVRADRGHSATDSRCARGASIQR
jgi:hypothetical protein